MSLVAPSATGTERQPLPGARTLIVGLVAFVAFLWMGNELIQAGYIRVDLMALETGEGLKRGGWLSQLVLNAVSVVDDRSLRQLLLSLTSSFAAAMVLALTFRGLRTHGWHVAMATLVLLALATHAMVLYPITGASRPIPLLLALAALIPAIAQFESVGDVQSAISLGLTLPFLLLAGPQTALLILPIAVASALADRDGRRDPRAFIAMVLVAALPSAIVAIGIVGFAMQAGLGIDGVLMPYLLAYHWDNSVDWRSALGSFAPTLPLLIVPALYCFLPVPKGERRQLWSTLAVAALPVYFAFGSSFLSWNMPQWTAPAALLATFTAWLATVRLPAGLRAAALILLMVSTALSWLLPAYVGNAAWHTSIATLLPLPRP